MPKIEKNSVSQEESEKKIKDHYDNIENMYAKALYHYLNNGCKSAEASLKIGFGEQFNSIGIAGILTYIEKIRHKDIPREKITTFYAAPYQLTFWKAVKKWIDNYGALTLDDLKCELLRLMEIYNYNYKSDTEMHTKLFQTNVQHVVRAFNEPNPAYLARIQDLQNFKSYLEDFINKLDPSISQDLLEELTNLQECLNFSLGLENADPDNNNYIPKLN